MYKLTDDDEIELAYTRFLALLLSLPPEKRVAFLLRAHKLYVFDRAKRRREAAPEDARGEHWKDPAKREEIRQSMREGQARRKDREKTITQ